MLTLRTYTEMSQYTTLEERFRYLALSGVVADTTFGSERYLNQRFYRSREWKMARDYVIVRDDGRDLGIHDFPISGAPRIHHMNPLTMEDIELGSDNLLNPEFLVATSLQTHNAIHYGDEAQLPRDFVERRPGDTQLWAPISGG